MIFRVLLIFLISFVWFRYFVKNLSLCLLYTIITTIIIELAINYFLKKRLSKKRINKEELNKVERISQTLIFEEQKNRISFFYNLAKKKHNAEKRTNYVIVKHEEGNVILYPHFSYKPLDMQDLSDILNKLRKVSYLKIVICCHEKTPQAINLSKKLENNIMILDKTETYFNLYKKYEMYPENLIELKNEKKIRGKELLMYAISRQKTKGYVISSIVILLSSFIVRYNVYYAIMSTVLLGLALASIIVPKIYKKMPEEIL